MKKLIFGIFISIIAVGSVNCMNQEGKTYFFTGLTPEEEAQFKKEMLTFQFSLDQDNKALKKTFAANGAYKTKQEIEDNDDMLNLLGQQKPQGIRKTFYARVVTGNCKRTPRPYRFKPQNKK